MSDVKRMVFESDGEDVQQIEVTVRGEKFMLREAYGDAVFLYRNLMLRQTELTEREDGEVKSVKIGDMADTEPLLVSRCLWDANGQNPQIAKVRSWKYKTIKWMYDWIKEHSEIDQEDDLKGLIKQRNILNKKIAKLEKEDPAKNGLPSIMSGTGSPPFSGSEYPSASEPSPTVSIDGGKPTLN